MKMNVKSIIAVLAAFAMVLSCSKVDELGNDNISGEENVVTGEIVTISAVLSDNMTKVSFTPEYEDGKPQSLALAWEAGDKLRIYNHADKTKYEDFELTAESVGAKKGYFTGVLPVADSYDVEVINGDVDYAVQVQPADGVTTSLKYMATATDVADVTSLTFTDYSSVLAITAKLPEGVAAVVGSVDITASEAIFNAGKTLTISLTEKGDAGTDGILHLFANLPQGNQAIAEGTVLLMHFNAPDTDHTVYTRYVELDASAFTAGRLNTINVNASQSDKHAGLATCDGTTAEKAYLIGDKYQMQAMHDLMEADATTYFKMVDDVDMEGINWTPLNGTSPYTMAMDFDGNDHTISNLTTDGTIRNSSFAAVLIGNIANVTFDKAEIEGGAYYAAVIAAYLGYAETTGNCSKVYVTNSSVNNASIAGGFAAAGQLLGTVKNCGVTNTDVTSTVARVGGFIGSVVEFDEISDCYAENVTVTSGSYYAGGFVGQLSGGGTVSGCHSTGSVSSTANTNYSRSGGLVGILIDGTVDNCYSTCDVTATSGRYIGGLIGQVDKGTVRKSHATGSVTTPNHYAGGLIGLVNGDLNVSQCYATGNVGNASNNRRGGLIGNIDKGTTTVSNCYATGTITSKSYSGGFIGGTEQGATVNVTNSYTKSSISGHEDAACVFCGQYKATFTCTGFIGWNVSNRKNWSYSDIVQPGTGNYMGTDGTISAKAKEFGWSETIWDLSGDEPRLKP